MLNKLANWPSCTSTSPICAFSMCVEWLLSVWDVLLMTLLCRLDGHVDLSERLIECQYELTDGLAYYLCSRRPGELLWLTLCTVIDRCRCKHNYFKCMQLCISIAFSISSLSARCQEGWHLLSNKICCEPFRGVHLIQVNLWNDC